MGGKKGRQVACKTSNSDFTLNDFANASAAVAKSGRMKKGETKPLNAADGQHIAESSKDDLAWYEKDLSDFEILDEETAIEVEKKENTGASIRSRTRRRKHNVPVSQSEEEEDIVSGHHYPQDMWFIIGNYIHPEDVVTFACLCRASHYVVHSAKFWLSMYNRYHDPACGDLPQLLQPHSISHIQGLRTRVVRSLYYLYPTFQQRITARQMMQRDPDTLTGATCVLQWHQKIKGGWNFFFKFRFTNVHPCHLSKAADSNDLLSEIDICANPEENCSVLRVVSSNFISLPPVMGQVLSKTFISVGHQMQFHKLKLLFNAEFNTRQQMTSGTAIVMDPVLNVVVCRWWDPNYPYNTT